MLNFKAFLSYINETNDYKLQHTSPSPEHGAPLHDLTYNQVYPNDVYSNNGLDWYGDGSKHDKTSYSVIRAARNNPDAMVKIYRAVPKDLKLSNGKQVKINHGDWVTLARSYAKEHGQSMGEHIVLSKTVPAKHLFTDGNSFNEFGYHPN
jgi:hypothetical protein